VAARERVPVGHEHVPLGSRERAFRYAELGVRERRTSLICRQKKHEKNETTLALLLRETFQITDQE
jgi:hypothetical protein